MKSLIIVFIALTGLSGCSFLSGGVPRNPNQNSLSGAGGIFREYRNWLFPYYSKDDRFSTIDYCELLGQYQLDTQGDCKIITDRVTPKIRNEVQDLILAASEQRCGEYVTMLHSVRGDSDVFWGGLSTLLSGAGAVVTSTTQAKALSAAGAVSSGIRSELGQAYFANLALEVISSGINTRRAAILDQIREARKNTDTTAYTLNGAIADALRYHAACNAITGLEVASESITRVENPGAAEIAKFIKNLQASGANVSTLLSSISSDEEAESTSTTNPVP